MKLGNVICPEIHYIEHTHIISAKKILIQFKPIIFFKKKRRRKRRKNCENIGRADLKSTVLATCVLCSYFLELLGGGALQFNILRRR
jgi:hypothetical protein